MRKYKNKKWRAVTLLMNCPKEIKKNVKLMKETEELYGHAFFRLFSIFPCLIWFICFFLFVFTFLGCWQEAGHTKKYLYV